MATQEDVGIRDFVLLDEINTEKVVENLKVRLVLFDFDVYFFNSIEVYRKGLPIINF